MAKKQSKKRVVYSRLTRALTGMTQAEYDKAFNTFASRVRNYNKIAGTNYQAAKEFYYSFRYADAPSPALKNIMKTVTTHGHYAGEVMPVGKKEKQKTETRAFDVFYDKWRGWFAASARDLRDFGQSRASVILGQVERGAISIKEANDKMRELAEERKTASKGTNFIY